MHPYFFIRADRKYIRINYHDVHYFEAAGNYVKVCTDSATYLATLTIKELEKMLPRHLFCRINRGTIVALQGIVSFDNEEIVFKNACFPFSNKYREELESRVTIIRHEGICTQKKRIVNIDR